MKIRNGFISNSSSSSFILFMPKEKMSVSDIESYFGGYSDELTQKQRSILSIAIWSTQYSTHNFEEERYEPEDRKTEVIYNCKREHNCTYFFDRRDPDEYCKECKFCKKLERSWRGDDFYELVENPYGDEEIKKRIQEKSDYSVYRLEIDDNNPPKFMGYDTARELRDVEELFKNEEKAIKVY